MPFKLRYCLVFLFLPTLVLAHGAVTTLSQTQGEYTIEFEYNTLGSIFAGDYVIYDTYLLKQSHQEPVDFDSAFIRIGKKNGPAVIAGSLAESRDIKGYASMSGMMHDPGMYTSELVFYKDGKNFAQALFDFEVKANTNARANSGTKDLIKSIALFLVGLGFGAGGILWLKPKKKI